MTSKGRSSPGGRPFSCGWGGGSGASDGHPPVWPIAYKTRNKIAQILIFTDCRNHLAEEGGGCWRQPCVHVPEERACGHTDTCGGAPAPPPAPPWGSRACCRAESEERAQGQPGVASGDTDACCSWEKWPREGGTLLKRAGPPRVLGGSPGGRATSGIS